MASVIKFRAGKKTIELVAGLSWHPLVPDNFKSGLVPLAQDFDLDLYVYRRSDHSVVGLTKKEDDVKEGQIPFALVAVDHFLQENGSPANALVAVAHPDEEDKYLYVMVHEGFIVVDGDQLGTEDEIRSRIMSDFSMGEWDLVVCPEHWRMSGSREADFAEIVPAKLKIQPAWRLKSVRLSWTRTAMKAGVLVAILFAGFYGYKYWRAAEAAKQAMLRAAQEAAALEEARKAAVVREPWPLKPTAAAVVNACSASLAKIGVIAGGWTFGKFACDGQSASVTWNHIGTAAWNEHMSKLFPDAVLSADGANATLSVKLPELKPAGDKGDEIPRAADRLARLRDLPSKYGIGVTIADAAAPMAPQIPGVMQPPPMAPAKWKEYSVIFNTTLSPKTALRAIDAPGFRIVSIDASLKGSALNYEIKGVQYAKP